MRVVDGGLRTLDNPINVHGLNNMDMNRPQERTRLDVNPVYPMTERNLDLTHLRRFRRVPLTQAIVNSFIYKYCYVMDVEENCTSVRWPVAKEDHASNVDKAISSLDPSQSN